MDDCAPRRGAVQGTGRGTSVRLRAWRGRAAIGLALAGLVACGGGGGSGGASGSKDTTPPEIKQVSATLGDPNPGTLDITSGDATRVITTPTPLTLKVFATDDQTATDKLEVQVLDASNKPIAGQTASFHNGLWEIGTTAQAGLTVHIAASDAAGNQTLWPNAAVFPTRTQALVQTWTQIVYANKASAGGAYPVLSRPKDTIKTDTWCQDDDQAGDGPSGGTWSVLADGRLKLETRHHMACTTTDFGSEWNTIETTRTADFYVDATYFSTAPYTHQGGAPAPGDITGTWSYKVDVASGGQQNTLTPDFVFNADGTFTQSTEDGHDLQGTYEVRPNPNYSADFGQLLVLTVDQMDGQSVTPTVSVHYFTTTAAQELLVDPFVQIP